MQAADRVFAALEADARFEVKTVRRGSNVRLVKIRDGDQLAIRQRLQRAGIILPKPNNAGWLQFKTNESLGRRPTGEIIAELTRG